MYYWCVHKVQKELYQMKKYFSLTAAALLAITFSTSTTFANDEVKSTGEEFQLKWDEVWNNIDQDPNYYSQTVDFTEGNNDSSGISTMSFNKYATGSTTISWAANNVIGNGVTDGQHLWTTTSVQTGLRDTSRGNITTYGNYDTAIAFGNAKSEVKRKYIPLDVTHWTALSVHTATMSGSIYEKPTTDSKFF